MPAKKDNKPIIRANRDSLWFSLNEKSSIAERFVVVDYLPGMYGGFRIVILKKVKDVSSPEANILHGGCWHSRAVYLCSFYSLVLLNDSCNFNTGFRLILERNKYEWLS